MSSMQLLLARVATLSLSATIAFGQTPTVESAMPAATPVSGTRAIAKDPRWWCWRPATRDSPC